MNMQGTLASPSIMDYVPLLEVQHPNISRPKCGDATATHVSSAPVCCPIRRPPTCSEQQNNGLERSQYHGRRRLKDRTLEIKMPRYLAEEQKPVNLNRP